MSAGADGMRGGGAAAPRVVAGRYELGDVLGVGGVGVVHRAQDRLLGTTVAVKSMRPGVLASEPRIRREIDALRLLRIPGVVSFRDEIEEGDEVHLVMDLVDGSPFPGRDVPRTWNGVGPRARALLETLGRVHAAGVVHRDLKPPNVLVDDAGRATLVDFGLSYGPSLGAAITRTGAIVGTPQYMAPEQVRGARIDGRTDLYAVGVMLYELFAGRLPIDAADFADLMRRKLSGSSVPLSRLVPDLPRPIADAVDRMIAVDPEDRPQSAAEAIRVLFGEGAPPLAEFAMPLLGPRAPLERVLDAARAGRPIDVFGPDGSGRSRLLEEAARVLQSEGRAVRWTSRGTSPYSGLSPILGSFQGLAGLSRDDAFAALDARLRDLLAGGAAVFVDDPDRTDRWSAAAVERCRGAGALVRVVAAPTEGCVALSFLEPQDLRGLFAGPSRILHLPEDAADELWRRTGGRPARVRAELAAWVRHGIARRADGKIAIDRAALRRLAGGLPVGGEILAGAPPGIVRSSEREDLLAWIALAWPHAEFDLLARVVGRPRWTFEPEIDALVAEGHLMRRPDGTLQPTVVPEALQTWPEELRQKAHRALAEALPRGATARLVHLAAAGEPKEVVDEALVLGESLLAAGRSGDALAAVEQALDVARRARDDAGSSVLCRLHARIALSEGTPAALESSLYEIGRSPGAAAELSSLKRFLEAAREAFGGNPDHALSLLDACGAFDDEELELRRHSQRLRCAAKLPIERHAALLDEIGAWAAATGGERARSNHRTWTASLRRRQGRKAEAAELHLECAADETSARVRMASLLNASQMLGEMDRRAEAARAAREARDLAIECRHPWYEAYAESLVRTLDYNLGRTRGADLDLVAAVAFVGAPDIEAFVVYREAAAAWRAGQRDVARDLAGRAAALLAGSGFVEASLVARALQIAGGAPLRPEDEAELVDAALAAQESDMAIDALGLLAPHLGAHKARAVERLVALASAKSGTSRDSIGDMISAREALTRAGVA